MHGMCLCQIDEQLPHGGIDVDSKSIVTFYFVYLIASKMSSCETKHQKQNGGQIIDDLTFHLIENLHRDDMQC